MKASFQAGRRLSLRAGVVALVTVVGAGAALAGCGGSSDTSGGSSGGSSSGGKIDTQLALVGYSTPKKAYAALTSAFQQTSAGKGVGFSQSFGASGSQSRAVDSGQPADIVAFSTTPDMTRLVKDGIVASDWDANPAKGMSSDSVVVFVVRKGNPKHITGWDDLIKSGVDVITPNPSTSGSARWNILAGYGAQLKEGKTPAQALDYVKTLLTKNVSVQDSSASAALKTFTSGKGDVLLDYESDAIAAKKAGDSIQYIISQADDPDRDADRRHLEEQARLSGQGVPELAVVGRGPDDLGAAGLPAGDAVGRQAVRQQVPDAAAAVHDRLPGRLGQGQGHVLRPVHRLDHQDRAGRGGSHCLLTHTLRQRTPVAVRRRRVRSASGGGTARARDRRMLYMSIIVLIPLAAVAVKAFSQSPSEFWQSITSKTAITRAGGDAGLVAWWSPRSAR